MYLITARTVGGAADSASALEQAVQALPDSPEAERADRQRADPRDRGHAAAGDVMAGGAGGRRQPQEPGQRAQEHAERQDRGRGLLAQLERRYRRRERARPVDDGGG